MSRIKEIEKNVEARRFQRMQEMIKKLGEGRNGSKIVIARGRTASFLEIRAASARSTEASSVPYEGVDCFFKNKPARKVFYWILQAARF